MSRSSFIRTFFLGIMIAIIMPVFADGENQLTQFPLEFGPYSAALYGNDLYIYNYQDASVSILDPVTYQVEKTVAVQSQPFFSIKVGGYVYILNSGTNTVSVIDSTSLLVKKTLTVSSGPSYATLVGTKLYVSNSGDDSVSVIDTTNNLVIKTIENLGSGPGYSLLIGTRLYVCNTQTSSISIIDTTKNVAMTSIRTGIGPIAMSLVGKELYILSNKDKNLTIINIDKNTRVLTPTLEENIPVGNNPRTLLKIGTKLYVMNKGDNSISVVDTTLKKVIKTIPVGKGPTAGVVLNNKIYVSNSEEGTVSVIDSSTDTVSQTFLAGTGVMSPLTVGSMVYVFNQGNKTFSIVPSTTAVLSAIDTNQNSGTYGLGEKIRINAIFNRKLKQGSTMTLKLNNGAEVLLDKVELNLLFGDYVILDGHNKDKLSVDSLKSVKIIDFAGLESLDYTIPTNKNIGNLKNIIIDTSKVVTLSAPPESTASLCPENRLYRLCPLEKAPENSLGYRENLVCENIITQAESKKKEKRISRFETLKIGVNMLHLQRASRVDYDNVYTDITLTRENTDMIEIIQTGLENKLISPTYQAFEPKKNISRIEAYALLMRSVCMEPEQTESPARSIHQKAYQEGITTKSWARFRPNSMITRSEVYILASQLADWADKNGGCDKLVCRK